MSTQGWGRNLVTSAAAVAAITLATQAHAGDVVRRIVTEMDPVAPSSAAYEEAQTGVTTSKWGGLADFNIGGMVSMGPEFWTGTFVAKGPTDDSTEYRREDMWPGERQKIDAIRLRWMVSKWEQPQSMRGWYLKGGYSYTRINSRANRYDETAGEGDALPQNILGTDPNADTDLITDLRHGAVVGFGNRWAVWEQKLTINLGMSYTANFKRSVTVDSKDANALADYEDMINTLPDTKLANRPTPEANLLVGWAW